MGRMDDEEYSEADGEGWSERMCFLDSEEDDNVEQKLIRTSPQIDPLDVEALEIAESEKNQFEILAVVFGDVGTSPLYTFDVIVNKYSLTGKDDVLGALSIVLYTLILIPLVKYTLVVLWAKHDGEGGTFVLYSLICRKANAGLLANQLTFDNPMSSFGLKVPSSELERSLKVKEFLESSLSIKWCFWLWFSTSMVIADVTPAISGCFIFL